MLVASLVLAALEDGESFIVIDLNDWFDSN
jgi:hypothetical protein